MAALRVICGPTAAGKSPLALALAEHVPLVIISADSRQLYRGFDIGTAKPTIAERARVPHWGVDVAEPLERFSAAHWAAGAHAAVAGATAAGRTPAVVGGTGFYLRALTAPLWREPPLDASRRASVARWLAPITTAELRRWCAALDPRRAHLGRAQLLRAVEVALLTGIPLSVWHAREAPEERKQPEVGAPGLHVRYLLVDPGPSLRDTIERRVDAMLAAGWMEEVMALDARVPATAPAWSASGYTRLRQAHRGELSRAAAREGTIIETRQYAKRQRTWFRHQLDGDVTRLDPAAPDALARALRWWHAGGWEGDPR